MTALGGGLLVSTRVPAHVRTCARTHLSPLLARVRRHQFYQLVNPSCRLAFPGDATQNGKKPPTLVLGNNICHVVTVNERRWTGAGLDSAAVKSALTTADDVDNTNATDSVGSTNHTNNDKAHTVTGSGRSGSGDAGEDDDDDVQLQRERQIRHQVCACMSYSHGSVCGLVWLSETVLFFVSTCLFAVACYFYLCVGFVRCACLFWSQKALRRFESELKNMAENQHLHRHNMFATFDTLERAAKRLDPRLSVAMSTTNQKLQHGEMHTYNEHVLHCQDINDAIQHVYIPMLRRYRECVLCLHACRHLRLSTYVNYRTHDAFIIPCTTG